MQCEKARLQDIFSRMKLIFYFANNNKFTKKKKNVYGKLILIIFALNY